ncbi:hypothetical protein ACFP77_22905, partial [Shinella zoogloeoides]
DYTQSRLIMTARSYTRNYTNLTDAISVRNPKGVPLAILELRENVVRQFRGRANSDPPIAVVDLLSRHAAESGWQGYEEAVAGRYIRPAGHVVLADMLAGAALEMAGVP